MDFHNSIRTEPLAFGEALDRAAIEIADDLVAGLSGAVREALQDPLTAALMKADKVDGGALADMLRRVGASLAAHPGHCYRC